MAQPDTSSNPNVLTQYQRRTRSLIAKHLRIKSEMMKFLPPRLQMTREEILDELLLGRKSEKSKSITHEVEKRLREEYGVTKAGPWILGLDDASTDLYIMARYPRGIMNYPDNFKGRLLGKDLPTGDLEQMIEMKNKEGKSKKEKKAFKALYEKKVSQPLKELKEEYKKLTKDIKKDDQIEWKDKKNVNAKNAAKVGGVTLVLTGAVSFISVAALGLLTGGIAVGIGAAVLAVAAIATTIGYKVSESRADIRRQNGLMKELKHTMQHEYTQNKNVFIVNEDPNLDLPQQQSYQQQSEMNNAVNLHDLPPNNILPNLQNAHSPNNTAKHSHYTQPPSRNNQQKPPVVGY